MRILLVDDHDLFREGLKYLLPALDESVVFLEASSLQGALGVAAGQQIDLILLDYYLPGVAGMGALESLRAAFESARLVVISGEEDPRVIRDAIERGAAGYIPKSSSRDVLVSALQQVLSGVSYLPPTSLSRPGVAAPAQAQFMFSTDHLRRQLSRRQYEVLLKAVEGKSNKVIARDLDISDHTVKAHLSTAFRTLGVQNRTEAVYVAARLGLHAGHMPDA